MLTTNTPDTGVDSITRLAQSWAISLAAENKSARTINGYTGTVSQFVMFLTERGMPSTAAAIRREHVETYRPGTRARSRMEAMHEYQPYREGSHGSRFGRMQPVCGATGRRFT